MIALLVIAAVVGTIWLLNLPGERFLRGFNALVEAFKIQRGVFHFFSGRSYATGRFRNRDVAIRLQLKRSRYGQGYLVVALRTAGQSTLAYDGIAARMRDETERRALSSIAAHDLQLGLEEGWLKVLWKPQGFFIFPGSFSEAKWRGVLDNLGTLAAALDRSA